MSSPAVARRRALADRLLRSGPTPAVPDAGRAGPGEHPATRAQQGMWLLHRMRPDDVAYNLGCLLELPSVVPAVLGAALDALAGRQAALRTCFVESAAGEPAFGERAFGASALVEPAVGESASGQTASGRPAGQPPAGRGRGQVRQVVHDRVTVPLTVVDLRHVADRAERTNLVAGLSSVLVDLPFDLRQAPLLRAMLVRGPGGADLVILATHHIVGDGESIALLEAELRDCYRTALLGGPPARPEPSRDFADVARDQLARLDRDRERLSAWWSDYLRGTVTELVLPLDRDRPANPGSAGHWVPLELTGRRAAAVRTFAAGAGLTPFAVLLACYAAVLGRYAGVEDLLVGVPFSGRRTAADRELVGLFVSTLPVRISGLGDPLEVLARRTALSLAEVVDHQDYPLDDLIDSHAADRDPALHPLFQASAVHQPRRSGGSPAAGPGTIRFDLSLQVGEVSEVSQGNGALDATLGGRAELFDAGTVARLAGQLLTLLDAGLASPGTPLGAVALGVPVPESAAMIEDSGWRAELGARLRGTPAPRVRIGDRPVDLAAGAGDGPVTLAGLDRPEELAAALHALADGRPLTVLDAGWPERWLTGCRAGTPAGLRVAELGSGGVPALVEVPPYAVAHAIRHATGLLGLAPGSSLVIGGVPPSVALLLGVLPALAAGAEVTLVPGGSAELLDLVAWTGADAALVDRVAASELIREGWQAGTRVVSHGDPSAELGILGPAALGHAAASVLAGRARLLEPVEIVTGTVNVVAGTGETAAGTLNVVAGKGESLPGAVGRCALGATVSDWRARERADGVLLPAGPGARPVLTVAELLAALPAAGEVRDDGAGPVLVIGPRSMPVPDWLAGCRVEPGQRPWRIGSAAPSKEDAPDATTAVVRLAAESCLDTPVADPDQTFFELGAHSLLIAQLAAELSELLDTPVALGDVFGHPSVRALSGWLAGRPDAAALAGRAAAVAEVLALDDAEVLRRLRAVPS